MEQRTVFLFGEAEKGIYRTPIECATPLQLFEYLGNAPEESLGIAYGMQFLSYRYTLLYFRVSEEGFSVDEYLQGLHFLRKNPVQKSLAALCLPGVGNKTILEAATPLSHFYKTPLIVSEKDLYDYLTSL